MENSNNANTLMQETEEQSSFNIQDIYTTLVLNWQWFVLSIILCLGGAYVYLRYTTPIYQTSAKLLVKEENNSRSRSTQMLGNMSNFGIMSNSAGLETEMEILKSRGIAKEAVTELKLYTTYYKKGRVKSRLVYKEQPVSVDINPKAIEKMPAPITMTVTLDDGKYVVNGSYWTPVKPGEEYKAPQQIAFAKTFNRLPAKISTKYGDLNITNNGGRLMNNGDTYNITVSSPQSVAGYYAGALNIQQGAKQTNIAILSMRDASPQRTQDYLQALVKAYNRQANDDKNEVALRTEEFINSRLEKISDELGTTEGSLERFKKNNRMIELEMSASETMARSSEFDQKLIDMNMQISLINNLESYLNNESNKYQVIPSNIGLSDASTSSLIASYNKIALDRNALMRTASDINPVLKTLTSQLQDLHSSIKHALKQAKKSLEIQRNAITQQYNKYQNQILVTPEQQRVMSQIGRQQSVQTALYTMLLQKREENSISLAATADKGKLIDMPSINGKVNPKDSMILLVALVLGIAVPAAILLVINFFKYKIESHDDVARRTSLPIIADVAVANEAAKTRGEIVVHENQNNTMEEIFRSMRTNLQFMLNEEQKVIMSTSSIAGEGKTFITSNLAISFALLGKKVVLIGLDIRKPRLAELFELQESRKGITPLLAMAHPTESDVEAQIVNSEVNNNLDLLLAGPVPPNPAELVERKQLDNIIDILKKKYDYILIDTAPVGLVTDTISISRVADVCVAVVRADYTPKDNILMLNELSQSGKLSNTAIVINGIDMSKKKYGYQYGYGKYGKYGQYGRRYGKYGSYSSYGNYGSYGNYSNSRYANKDDNSVKL